MAVQEIKKGQIYENKTDRKRYMVDFVVDNRVCFTDDSFSYLDRFSDYWKLVEEPKINIINPTPLFGITDDKVVQAVMNDLNERSKIGKEKYNTTLERTDLNLKDWLQHAYEETLDKANYLKRAILELEK